jgi:hypothetical protein
MSSAPSLKLSIRTSTMTGRVEVKFTESDYSWILVILRTQVMEDLNFGP